MIGIHDTPGSFSDRWIQYCEEKKIPFKRVKCLATDAIPQCEGLEAVLWHWEFWSPREQLVARQVIAALEAHGLTVFPNSATCWHYDDKIAQKYLLEAVGAPLVTTWVFTDRSEAMAWIAEVSWPKVFKLRCGSCSANVRLVRSRGEAEALCRTAFGRGFPAAPPYFADLQTRVRKTKSLQEFWDKLKRVPKMFARIMAIRRQMARQQGYLYFQEFLPENSFDTRVTVIGDRAFGFIRQNRPNDFRASGSGQLGYNPALIDKRCVQIAFDVTNTLGIQSLAFDFLQDPERKPRICEISYCYLPSAIHDCAGHWNRQLIWQEGCVWPQDAILEDLIAGFKD